MSNSNILAKCDMVLAVSEDTINYQFKQLWQQSVIKKDWKLLVREVDSKGQGGAVKTQEDSDFDDVMKAWNNAQKELSDLFAQKKYEEYGKKLGDYQSKGVLYNYGWSGNINAPAITILQKDTQNLLFKLNFASGALYSSSDPTKPIITYDLKDTIYAFNVPIGRIEINDKNKILTPAAKDQVTKVIRDSGLTDADFTIESLFMDFENANISNFDESTSKFPSGSTKSLQITVEDYFKLVVAKEKNPFILGYGVSVKKIDSPKALFQPTSVHYSTSYSSKKGCNAFNFVMMQLGSDFPSGQNVGILPKSLLETASDISKIDGVLAINYTYFQSAFLDPFIEATQAAITKGFGTKKYTPNSQKWSLSTKSSVTKNTDEPPSDGLQDTHIDSDMTLDSSMTLSNKNSELLLRTTIDYSLDIKVRPWELLHAGRHTEGEYWLSTSGKHQKGPGGHVGQQGIVNVSIQTGTNGKMNVSIDKTQVPYIGYDKANYSGYKGVGIWGVIASDWQNFSEEDAEIASLKAAQKISTVIDDTKSALSDKIKSVNNGKVILPLGEIYSFNSIRLSTDTNQQDNPVLFDVKYAPVTS